MKENEKKETERLARIMCGHKGTCQDCLGECIKFGFAFDCECLYFAKNAYKAGCRNQSDVIKEFAEKLKTELFANCVIIQNISNPQKEDMDSSEAFQLIDDLAKEYGYECSAYAHGGDHYKYYPTTHTNADRVRSMNDKELAEYIFDLGNGSEYCYGHCAYQDNCTTKGLDHDTCIKGVIDWLKQPVKEECNETD